MICSVKRYIRLQPIRGHGIHYLRYQLFGFFNDSQFGYPFFKLLLPKLNKSEKQFNFQSLSNAQKLLIAYCMHVPFKSLEAQLKKLYAKETILKILVKCLRKNWDKEGSQMEDAVKIVGYVRLPKK